MPSFPQKRVTEKAIVLCCSSLALWHNTGDPGPRAVEAAGERGAMPTAPGVDQRVGSIRVAQSEECRYCHLPDVINGLSGRQSPGIRQYGGVSYRRSRGPRVTARLRKANGRRSSQCLGHTTVSLKTRHAGRAGIIRTDKTGRGLFRVPHRSTGAGGYHRRGASFTQRTVSRAISSSSFVGIT